MKKYIKLKCDYCMKMFKRLLSIHNNYINVESHKHNHIFCSRLCSNKYNTQVNTITTNCGNCNKKVIRHNSQAKKSKSGKCFCSKFCAATYNYKFKKKSRRSKIEAKFYNLLVKEFPNLNILPNDKNMLDGLEVDIAIPSLKLAIEWNGIVHFKPIYGQQKLDKIQNKDAKKLKIAVNKNINLIVIPDLVSNDKILQQAFSDTKNIINKLI
ncbi:hypothetical protein LCGC14_0608630 [marine sediment metagenome]|uniref:Uncharacterized protein n=1 Tax=marine sediment metagenome TaxID=412755 RepID=A0A0F9RSK7_9ZZZZ